MVVVEVVKVAQEAAGWAERVHGGQMPWRSRLLFKLGGRGLGCWLVVPLAVTELEKVRNQFLVFLFS